MHVSKTVCWIVFLMYHSSLKCSSTSIFHTKHERQLVIMSLHLHATVVFAWAHGQINLWHDSHVRWFDHSDWNSDSICVSWAQPCDKLISCVIPDLLPNVSKEALASHTPYRISGSWIQTWMSKVYSDQCPTKKVKQGKADTKSIKAINKKREGKW